MDVSKDIALSRVETNSHSSESSQGLGKLPKINVQVSSGKNVEYEDGERDGNTSDEKLKGKEVAQQFEKNERNTTNSIVRLDTNNEHTSNPTTSVNVTNSSTVSIEGSDSITAQHRDLFLNTIGDMLQAMRNACRVTEFKVHIKHLDAIRLNLQSGKYQTIKAIKDDFESLIALVGNTQITCHGRRRSLRFIFGEAIKDRDVARQATSVNANLSSAPVKRQGTPIEQKRSVKHQKLAE